MPSYRYTREIKQEDLQPDKPPELNKKQKAANWWRYHWGWVAGGLAVVLLAVFFIRDVTSTPVPDVTVGVLSPYNLPDEVTSTLADALAEVWGDVDGNGEALVQIDVYTVDALSGGEYDENGYLIDPEEDASSQAQIQDSDLSEFSYNDPYAQMSGVVRLTGAFESGDVIIFLADPEQAEAYQENYSIYGMESGEAAQDLYSATVAFSELAALNELDLTYHDQWTGTDVDVAEMLADYRVGLRLYNGSKLARMDDGRDRFEAGRALLEQLK